jgi:hypothetical protein
MLRRTFDGNHRDTSFPWAAKSGLKASLNQGLRFFAIRFLSRTATSLSKQVKNESNEWLLPDHLKTILKKNSKRSAKSKRIS